MRTLKTLILFLSVSFSYGQVSNADFVRDLLGDFRKSLEDSSMIGNETQIIFQGEGEAIDYLNDLQGLVDLEKVSDSLHVQLQSMALSISKIQTPSGRNSSYIRKLKLTMNYPHKGELVNWNGGLTDRCSDEHIAQLIEEPFPIPMTGDYLDNQPSGLRVILLSILSLSLIAALYFIRT